MLDAALAFVRKNTRTKTIIDPETGKRCDRSDYPQGAVREAQIISFCKTPRTRKELAQFLGLSSATYAIKTYIQPLIDKGTIKLQIPDRPSSPNQKYYS